MRGLWLMVFAGKVGTGFTRQAALELRATLDRIKEDVCPFSPRPRGWLGRNAHWVRPALVAEVSSASGPSTGRSVIPQALREDKKAREVIREVPASTR